MFRFTIRDVLWLTVVVGMGVGWSLQWRADRERFAVTSGELDRTKVELRSSERQLNAAQKKLLADAYDFRIEIYHLKRELEEQRSETVANK